MHLSFVRRWVFASLLLFFVAFPIAETRAQAPAPGANLTTAAPVAIRTVAHAVAPTGLAVDSQNRIYFTSANRIFRTDPAANGTINLIAGNGEPGSLGDGGPATAAQLNITTADSNTASLAVDPDNNLYLLDPADQTIRRIDAATGVISTVVGRWAHALAASNYSATGAFTFAPAADSGASVRLFFLSASNLISGDLTSDAFAPISKELTAILQHATASAAPVRTSVTLAISPDSRELYIGSPAGLFRAALAASTGPDSLTQPALLHPVLSDGPYSLAISPAGQLYISIANDNRILRFDSQTRTLTPIATSAELNSPGAIAFDHAGNLFVADTGNNAIREITFAAPGTVSLFPTRYPFATQLVGGQTPPHTFVLTNGTAGTISGLTVQFVGGATPPDFVQTNTCGSQLDPNQTCKIDVSFAPQAVGQRTAILSVTDSDPSSPQTAELTGFADDFTLNLQDGSTDTLTVVAGGKATFNLVAASDSTFSGKIAIHCPNNLPLYVTCTINPSSVTIAPGSPQKFTAVFQTTARVSAFVPSLPGPVVNTPNSKFLIPLAALFAILISVWLFFPRSTAPRGRRLAPALFGTSILIALFAFAACGKKYSTSSTAGGIGTVAGTYSFTVTASAQNATRAFSLILTVQ